MNKITYIAGSFPKIVTTGKTRRKNEEGINDPFLRDYISLIARLLLIKKDLKDIRFVYIGGYEGIENINTAKLYFSAFNYFLKALGFGELSKNNFLIIDEESYLRNKTETVDALENTDFLLLGLGSDEIFGKLLDKFGQDGISIKNIAEKNNILIASVCAGSVLSAQNIYGGKYDSFYHDRKDFVYPTNYKTLNFNPVTIETNLYPESQTEEKNIEFRDTCLLPDSFKKAFFGCRPNSYIIMNENNITAVGEVYLFIDGEILEVSVTGKKDITKLVELVNQYNVSKNLELKLKIIYEIKSLNSADVDMKPYEQTFLNRQREIEDTMENRKKLLKQCINDEIGSIMTEERNTLIKKSKLSMEFLEAMNLNTDETNEIIFKYNLIAIVKKYSILYQNNYSQYFRDLYDIFTSFVEIDPRIVLCFVQCFSSSYQNKDMKKLLTYAKLETTKRVNSMSANNAFLKKLWRVKPYDQVS